MSEKKVKSEKKGNLFKIIIIVLLVLIMLAAGIIAGMMIVKSNSGNNDVITTSKEQINEAMFSLDEQLVNLGDEGGRRYIKIHIFIGFEENKKLPAELESKKPILRDAVNSVLRSKKTEDLTALGTEKLKNEILIRINSYLNEGKATNIYFYDILIQ